MTSVFQAPEGPKSGIATPVVNVTTGVADGKQLVDFSCVIQELLNKERARLHQLNAIIRCDTLPHVYANANDMKRLCDLLIGFILKQPHRRTKLFIHIKCNLLESEALPETISGRLHLYKISFHTNSCNEVSWQSLHEQELAEFERICSRHSGIFVSASNNADCLFDLTLPGKLYSHAI
jgi:hypothetical protein